MSKVWSIILVTLLLVACAAPATAPTATVAPSDAVVQAATEVPVDTATVPPDTATPTALPPTTTPTALPPTATPTPAPVGVWLDPSLPPAVHDRIVVALEGQAVAQVLAADQADLRVGWKLPVALGQWVYAVAVPFPTLTDDITWQEVQQFWAGAAGALSAISEDGQTPTLFITQETLAALEQLLGPLSDQVPVQVKEQAELVDAAWAARPHAWAIVPFDELEPRWKVLIIDDLDVLDKSLDMAKYPLAADIGAEGQLADQLAAALGSGEPLTDRDTAQMTTLVMTGVTAMVRATAYEMEQRGVLYPGELINPILRSADITHISNEIPFAKNCPPPNRNQEALVFCSSPSYIELLRDAGADVIELTGNHFQDYGSQATLDTLAMYNQEGWPYYGGGEDLERARQPIKMESNGNTFSFIGANPVGPTYAWATDTEPGAATYDPEYMHAQLAQLAKEVDIPIATWQYWEFYFYEPTPQQQEDFRGMVDAGARIVSGSQAHHPQAIEFYHGGFIHYGLGNLFFDQMWSLGTRQEMVDRHVIYKGKHLSTELLTFMLENFAQPRPMTDAERRDLLQAVFQASGW